MLKDLLIGSTLAKIALFPAYLSTDFDVHRNWLAITSSLPLSQWYFENTSQWTLDYPPFFAYFEYILSKFVTQSALNDGILAIRELDGQYGFSTVVFQRATVVVSELLLAVALYVLNDKPVFAVLWMCPCWFVLDHIHFQYNGFLFGLFVLSVVMIQRRRMLLGAFLFSTVLCFKHIYLYVAPAFFMHLFKECVVRGGLVSTVKLGLATLIPFAAAFGPIYAVSGEEGIEQLISRLFPFSRGLTHAYWAPNFWALYSAADRVLGILNKNSVPASTRGIVGQVAFSNLPEIVPGTTFAISAALQLVFATWGGSSTFVENVTMCGFASFLFGWHVHEKAVLTVLVPLALICRKSPAHLNAFLPLLVSACYSLLPLLWTPAESVFKYVYTSFYLIVVAFLLPKTVPGASFGVINWLYFAGFAFVLPFYELVPVLVPKYEYAGLMLVSLYSSLGVFLSFLRLSWIYITAK